MSLAESENRATSEPEISAVRIIRMIITILKVIWELVLKKEEGTVLSKE